MNRALLCFLFLAGWLFIAGCGPSKKAQSTSKKGHPFLPEVVSNLDFGMSMEEVKALRPNIRDAEGKYDFRKEYLEEVYDNGIEYIGYYFNKAESWPLYEIIIGYDSEDLMKAKAFQLLGEKNHEKGEEWMLDSGRGYQIHAWTFQKKLVIVGKIGGTEWDE